MNGPISVAEAKMLIGIMGGNSLKGGVKPKKGYMRYWEREQGRVSLRQKATFDAIRRRIN